MIMFFLWPWYSEPGTVMTLKIKWFPSPGVGEYREFWHKDASQGGTLTEEIVKCQNLPFLAAGEGGPWGITWTGALLLWYGWWTKGQAYAAWGHRLSNLSIPPLIIYYICVTFLQQYVPSPTKHYCYYCPDFTPIDSKVTYYYHIKLISAPILY